MKKNVLAMSIATMIGGLGFAGIASADRLPAGSVGFGYSPSTQTAIANSLELGKAGDVGHILVVPYFTAQDGNMSVFHVVNTDTQNAKAVKVRFRGASNSDDILDFQVFLSPGDVWTGSVAQGADGRAALTTADTSCTVPRIAQNTPVPFVTQRLNPALTDAQKANETREGYVELFTMADIPKNYSLAHPVVESRGKANALYATVKHKTSGAAPDCDTTILESLADGGNLSNITSVTNALRGGFDTPTGSLFGDWYIINVPQTTTFSGGATVIRAESSPGALGRGNFVHFPQVSGVVTQTTANENTADPLFRGAGEWYSDSRYGIGPEPTGAAVDASNYDLPDLSTPYVVTTVSAIATAAPLLQAGLLTEALTVGSVTNQYATAPFVSAKTDWVFSMPTRRYSVAYDYDFDVVSKQEEGLRYSKLWEITGPLLAAQRSDVRQSFNPDLTAVKNNKQICVQAGNQAWYDREERTQTAGAVFSPGQVSVLELCGEASVLSFTTGTGVLGASVAASTVAPPFTNGWSTVPFTKGGVGLPVQGFAATKLSNPNTGSGVSGNYGITWIHR